VLTYSPVSRSGEFHPDLDNALRRAAARGVEVRLIVSDWAKRPPEIHHLGSLAALPNVTVKLTAIPRHSKGYIPFARVQHAKFLVVDKDSAWLGSSNWSKDYFYASRNAGFIIQGKGLTAQLRRVFFSSWTGPYAERVDPAKSYEPPVTGD
jgi:phosphatidylserine/phosphatidylglycerophosphate/cardiolipin synthase-like enzyme